MIDISKIINRIKAFKALKKDKQVAVIIGLSEQNFNNKKKRNTLIPDIVEWAINNGVDLNWLITGQSHVDEALLAESIAWTDSQLKRRKKKLTSEKKAIIALNYYQKYIETGEIVDDKEMDRYLRLVS